MKLSRYAVIAATALSIPLLLALWTARSQSPQGVESLKLPADYRQWTHVKSMVIFDEKHPLFENFGGMHHIYVNAKGLEASRKRGTYPQGSVLVFTLYEADNQSGAYVAGKKKVEAIMVKDSKQFPDTGGWGFQAFDPATGNALLTAEKAKSGCFDCHAAQKGNDYVFSQFTP